MAKGFLSIDNLIVFKFKNETYYRVGVHGKKEHSNKIFYNSTIYYLYTVDVCEYGYNDGEYSKLYQAIEKAFPRYTNKKIQDTNDHILVRDLNLDQLPKIEKAYNKLINNKDQFDELFNRR